MKDLQLTDEKRKSTRSSCLDLGRASRRVVFDHLDEGIREYPILDGSRPLSHGDPGVPSVPEGELGDSRGTEEEERLAARMMGRWRSGAPLALSPENDEAALGADPARNNAFLYRDDPKGYKTLRRPTRLAL
ncbi:hypothetical protein WME75_20220 [Sorangium sp. So ce1014]